MTCGGKWGEVSPTLINPCRESKRDKEEKKGENERREKMREIRENGK